MSSRRWIAVVFGVLAIAVAAGVYALPEMVRRVAAAHIHALTGRAVAIERVELGLLSGSVAVHGFRLAERVGEAPFAHFERLQLRVRLPALLMGHLSIRELVLERPVVRIVRLPGGDLNVSDLVGGPGEPARPLDITIARFALEQGTVILEDRVLAEPRTWTSERIEIEGHNISTRTSEGSATARSVTAGAAVAMDVRQLRLFPIHLKAQVTTSGFDLSLARLYLPADAPLLLERGRAHTSLDVELDAREGLRAQAAVHVEDLALVKPRTGDLAIVAPWLSVHLVGLAFRDGDLELGRLDVAGALGAPHPRPGGGHRMQMARVQASAAGLTWPAHTEGKIEVHASIPEGGTLAVSGTVRPLPEPSQLRFQLTKLDLAPWARVLPLAARIGGLVEADLRIDEPLAAGMPARVEGVMAVDRLTVADGGRELIRAARIEASGLEVRWPDHMAVERVLVRGPRAIVERDRHGAFLLQRLGPVTTPGGEASESSPARGDTDGRFAVDVRQVVVRHGGLSWRDDAVAPRARLDVSAIDATLTGVRWPVPGPIGVRVALRPPGGGHLRASGRVEIDPFIADLRLAVDGAGIAPYQPYLPMPVRVSGTADAALAVVVQAGTERRATIRGRGALSGLDVRDGERTVLRVERATATGVDVDWPQRIALDRVVLSAPWLLVERDEGGRLTLPVLPTRPPSAADGDAHEGGDGAGATPAVAVARVTVERGGMRVADQ